MRGRCRCHHPPSLSWQAMTTTSALTRDGFSRLTRAGFIAYGVGRRQRRLHCSLLSAVGRVRAARCRTRASLGFHARSHRGRVTGCVPHAKVVPHPFFGFLCLANEAWELDVSRCPVSSKQFLTMSTCLTDGHAHSSAAACEQERRPALSRCESRHSQYLADVLQG